MAARTLPAAAAVILQGSDLSMLAAIALAMEVPAVAMTENGTEQIPAEVVRRFIDEVRSGRNPYSASKYMAPRSVPIR
jgi:hypothetical protein